MPIGEMFDLEELAKHCRECGRWSFFLSSVPLKASDTRSFASLISKFGGFVVRANWNTGSWWRG